MYKNDLINIAHILSQCVIILVDKNHRSLIKHVVYQFYWKLC